MLRKNKVTARVNSILIAFLLLAILVLPNINQWIHLAEDHHKEVLCVENNLHFHADELGCVLTATFTPPYFSIDQEPFSPLELQKTLLLPIEKTLSLKLSSTTIFRLRGPPIFLFPMS